uniref:Uncharacterized protein n=2 Tax=Macaca fascicularis TaxID=9541 RepID=G7PQ10_MACFA
MPYKNHLNQSPLLVSRVVLCWRSAQMVSMALEVLMLLALLIWTGAENLHVKINCSLDWLMVSVIPLAESRNLYIFADELHLGMGCPANWIHTYVYEFIYLVHDCGIRTRVISEETLLFQTELYFTPRNIDHNPEEIHLECSASSYKQPPMASHVVDNAELGSASAHGTPGSEAGPHQLNNSVYQPIDGSQDYQKGKLQVLGAIQILNAAMILALGVFLGSLQYLFHLQRHLFFFTFYTGYPFWGAAFFCSSGTLSVVAGRKPTRTWIRKSFEMNITSATIAVVGIAFLSVNLAVNIQLLNICQSSTSPDLCNYMGSTSNGMVSLLLILTSLELCVTISTFAMLCKANCCNSRVDISSPPNSVESRMPPYENNSESMNI